MPGTTPTYGFRYQTLSDAPNGASLGENLANDVEDKIETVDAAIALINTGDIGVGTFGLWDAYTPAWTTTGATPGIGNGTLIGGKKKIGRLGFVRVYFKFGSTTDPGSSLWKFSLDYPAASPSGLGNAAWVGAGVVRDDSAGASGHHSAIAVINAGSSTLSICVNGLLVGASATYYQMAVDDYFSVTAVYETS